MLPSFLFLKATFYTEDLSLTRIQQYPRWLSLHREHNLLVWTRQASGHRARATEPDLKEAPTKQRASRLFLTDVQTASFTAAAPGLQGGQALQENTPQGVTDWARLWGHTQGALGFQTQQPGRKLRAISKVRGKLHQWPACQPSPKVKAIALC